MKILEYKHNPAERALNCSICFDIAVNQFFKSYGRTESVVCMIGDQIIYHSTMSDTISWLCGIHKRASSILSLLKSEGISFDDSEQALRSISKTVQAKANKEIYETFILPVSDHIIYKG